MFNCPTCKAHEAQIKHLQGLVDQLLHQIAPKPPEPEKPIEAGKDIGETILDREQVIQVAEKEVFGEG
jgi:anti-sigma factor RsiW